MTSFTLADSTCAALKGCAKKSCEVKRQMEIAKTHENDDRVKGLEKALRDIKDNCKDEDIIKKIEEELREAQDDLKEHQEELVEATTEEKRDKIKKYEKKIVEDKVEIEKLERELATESKKNQT